MSNNLHNFKCNVLVQPPQFNRFYMDMQVYEIVEPKRMELLASPSESLIWRGICLAVEVRPSSRAPETDL